MLLTSQQPNVRKYFNYAFESTDAGNVLCISNVIIKLAFIFLHHIARTTWECNHTSHRENIEYYFDRWKKHRNIEYVLLKIYDQRRRRSYTWQKSCLYHYKPKVALILEASLNHPRFLLLTGSLTGLTLPAKEHNASKY